LVLLAAAPDAVDFLGGILIDVMVVWKMAEQKRLGWSRNGLVIYYQNIGIVVVFVIERNREQRVGWQSRSWRAALVFIYGSGGVGLSLSDCAECALELTGLTTALQAISRC
jgi:hypothetical protein